MGLKIDKAEITDLPIIREIAEITWPYNYKNMISAEQIDYMLKLMYSDKSLLEQLQINHIFLIAREADKPVGFASYELNFKGFKQTRLHKIYVLPQYQGKGVGKKLMQTVISLAIDSKNHQISLTVNKNNTAVSFYKTQGFIIKEEVKMPIGNGFYMDDYIMQKSFNPVS